MTGLISVGEARRFVLSSCRPLAPVAVPVAAALGLVLAEGVRSEEAVPPFPNSSMDGYAVRAADVTSVPVKLRVAGVLMAGDDPGPLVVGEGEAVRIMTGAVLPRGADAVCMVEHTRAEGAGVVIEEAVISGTYVRLAGDDIAPGDEVFAAGTTLGPVHIGVITSLGVEELKVFPRPRVGVVSSGDELVTGPAPLPVGKIRDSNRPGLLARLHSDGFEAVDLGWVADEADVLVDALNKAALACDAVLTSGGVSVGERDLVKIVLGRMGGKRARWLQVAVRPAKPFAFSLLPPRDVPVFGLPGNPVSALVSYELFARPALRLMAGHQHLYRPRLRARAEVALRRIPDGKLHLLRVSLSAGPDGALRARPSGGQGSHQLLALSRANALALVPDGEGVAAGESVDVWLLDADSLSDDASTGDASTVEASTGEASTGDAGSGG